MFLTQIHFWEKWSKINFWKSTFGKSGAKSTFGNPLFTGVKPPPTADLDQPLSFKNPLFTGVNPRKPPTENLDQPFPKVGWSKKGAFKPPWV